MDRTDYSFSPLPPARFHRTTPTRPTLPLKVACGAVALSLWSLTSLGADSPATPPHLSGATATQSKIAMYVEGGSNVAHAYAFNATLLNPSGFPNPYVGIFHSEPPSSATDDSVSAVYGQEDRFGTNTGPFLGGCNSSDQGYISGGSLLCSPGVGAYGNVPVITNGSTYHHNFGADFLVTGGGSGQMDSGAGNPHLVTPSSTRYGLYFLTVDSAHNNHMMAADIDPAFLGNIRFGSFAYKCSSGTCTRGVNHDTTNGTLYGVTDATSINEYQPPALGSGNNPYAAPTLVTDGGTPRVIKSRATTGSNGLIGSMTTDPDADPYLHSLSGSPTEWDGKQFFYYTDEFPDGSNKQPKLVRRRIMPFIYGMGPEEELQVDIKFAAASGTVTYNAGNPAPYILVHYSPQMDKFLVIYYCNGPNDQPMDLCIQRTSNGNLQLDGGGRMQIVLGNGQYGSSDRTTYGLNMVNDAGISDRKDSSGHFWIGQFGARLDGYGMLVNSSLDSAGYRGYPLMLYFPVGNPTDSPQGATGGVQMFVKGVCFSGVSSIGICDPQ